MMFSRLGLELFERYNKPGRWIWLMLLWPGFLCIWLYNRIKDSNFGWWVRYQIFKAKH